MIEIEYTKKPSITTLSAAARKAVAAGNTFISLQWGENRIIIERTQWGWHGTGWIGRTGGQDLAEELETQETGRDRFGVNIHNSFNTLPKKADPVAAEIVARTGVPADRLIVKHIGA